MRAAVWMHVVAAGAGVAIVVAFVTPAGIDYRLREEQGLAPEYTPAWMVAWIVAGLWSCALSTWVFSPSAP